MGSKFRRKNSIFYTCIHISLPELPRMYLKVVNLIISQFKIDTLTTLNSLRTLVYKNIYAACYDSSIYVIL